MNEQPDPGVPGRRAAPEDGEVAFVRCACGRRHWGPYGAAGLLLVPSSRDRVLLQLRSGDVLDPHTWALPGGALERGESPTQAALREAREETGLLDVTAEREIPGVRHPDWGYTYVLATTPTLDLPVHTSWEADDHRWFALDAPPVLLPALAHDWPRLLAEIGAGDRA